MFRTFAVNALILASFAGCAKSAVSPAALQSSERANVFGKDGRTQMAPEQAGFQNIVYIPNSRCTGSFVWKNLVLTAAHCITSMFEEFPEGTFNLTGNYTVQLGRQGKSVKQSMKILYVWWGTFYPDDDRSDDWALIQVDGNAKTYFETLPALKAGDEANKNVTLAGYSTDLTLDGAPMLSGMSGCSIREHDAKSSLVFHDCDSTRGSSGAPMWKKIGDAFTVVALNVAEFRDDGNVSLKIIDDDWSKHRNISVDPASFAYKIEELRKKFPNGAE